MENSWWNNSSKSGLDGVISNCVSIYRTSLIGGNMDFIMAHKIELLGLLLAISEVLDAIPSIQASSIWKLVYSGIKALVAPK